MIKSHPIYLILHKHTYQHRRRTTEEVAEKWDGLTSNIRQMVDLRWLEKLQGDANGLTEAMAT